MKPLESELSISFFNSSALPITICSVLSSLVQIGIGIPQKRERDKFQSTKFSSQFPKRPIWHYLRVGSNLVHLIAEIGLATFIVLIFAEFIPRAIFRAKSNSLLTRMAYITDFFYQMFYPLASGLINLAQWILKYLFNVRLDKTKEPFNRSDLKNLFHSNMDEEKQERNTQLIEQRPIKHGPRYMLDLLQH